MAPVIPDPAAIMAFPDQPGFEAWLSANHATASEVWLKIHKSASGLPTVTYPEALDVALSWGWIDGQKKSLDAASWLQRFSPRGPRSIWSQTNRGHVERLIAAGRMQPAGLRQVEAARADGRWDRAYAGASKMGMPADLMAAIEADPAALATYRTLDAANRYALAFRTHNMKTAAGRQKKIASLVEMLRRGEAPHPIRGSRR
jgi:uncharacterized protein YdeI (YjbR/CyaY-like superfamily)